MVDALVLEASTSVCGFESHLPHQKEKGAERCLFLLLPNAARCGGVFRFAPCVAGTCGSPTHAPSLFCDTIQFAIETDRSCHRPGPGAKWRSGLFSLPQICSAPSEIQTDRPSHRLPQDSPFRIRAAERHTKTIHSSLFSLHLSHSGLPLPLPESARELLPAGAGNQFPGSNAGLQNALSAA